MDSLILGRFPSALLAASGHSRRMETSAALQVVLHLDRGTANICGSLEDDRAVRRPFFGWLELSVLLDAVRAGRDPDGHGEQGPAIPGQQPSSAQSSIRAHT